MKNILTKLKRLFCLYDISSSKPVLNLEKRIIKAKEVVRSNSYGDMILVENYHEVREILQYADTLGMALFVRDFIARKVDTDKCVKYLKRNYD